MSVPQNATRCEGNLLSAGETPTASTFESWKFHVLFVLGRILVVHKRNISRWLERDHTASYGIGNALCTAEVM